MTMREYTILPLALALIAMVSGCNPKKDSPKSATAVASSDASAVASGNALFLGIVLRMIALRPL